jgi:hypothetical protein
MYDAWESGADTPGRDEEPIPSGDEDADRAATPAGSADDVAHVLRPTLEAFAHERDVELIVRLHYPGMAFESASRAVELFGERVLPALKGS